MLHVQNVVSELGRVFADDVFDGNSSQRASFVQLTVDVNRPLRSLTLLIRTQKED